MRYHITTFGCQQNSADSERIATWYESRGYEPSQSYTNTDILVVNTCVIRERATEKIFGFVRNVYKENPKVHIVITGCLIGAAMREPSGKMLKSLQKRLPSVEFLPLEEVGFEHPPKREKGKHAWLPISNGCNNYCTYCIVPFSRGRERSRTFEEILEETKEIIHGGYSEVTLLGQNVNSYGSDLVREHYKAGESITLADGSTVDPVMVNHLGRYRIPTLFPYLLDRVASFPFRKVSFMSSNPWDFSDELINVIAKHKNIDRLIHLPIQSGSNAILKAMNRWYTREEYMDLIERIREHVKGVKFTTDVIVGFPGETREHFEETLDMARKVGFEKGHVAYFSPRPGTKAMTLSDDISIDEKKRRFHELDRVINNTAIRNCG